MDLLEGLPCRFLYENCNDWRMVLNDLGLYDNQYDPCHIDYQRLYHEEKETYYRDYSTIFYDNQRPIGILPVCVYERNGVFVLGSNGSICTYPRIIDHLKNSQVQKKMTECCIELLFRLSKRYGIETVEMQLNTFLHPLDVFYEKLISINAEVSYYRHDLFVNLQEGAASVWTQMRKSYKSLINKGKKIVTYEIVDASSKNLDQVFDEFRELHMQVSGRSTRGVQTWRQQKRIIHSSGGFVVVNRKEHSELIGATLIEVTPSMAYYSVGAYNRELFHLYALGHLNQMIAIERLCEIGIKWYNIGSFPRAADIPPPTEKEISIGAFKKGFATDMAIINKIRIHVKEMEKLVK